MKQKMEFKKLMDKIEKYKLYEADNLNEVISGTKASFDNEELTTNQKLKITSELSKIQGGIDTCDIINELILENTEIKNLYIHKMNEYIDKYKDFYNKDKASIYAKKHIKTILTLIKELLEFNTYINDISDFIDISEETINDLYLRLHIKKHDNSMPLVSKKLWCLIKYISINENISFEEAYKRCESSRIYVTLYLYRDLEGKTLNDLINIYEKGEENAN